MKNSKIVGCRTCGIEMVVNKFASNTPNCSDCRSEGHKLNRKKSDRPRRNTKAWYIEEIINKLNEYKEIHEQLMELHIQGKIKYGVIMVHGLYDDYSYRWFYGMLDNDTDCKGYGLAREKTTVKEFDYHLARIKEEIKKAREIIEENK